MPHGTDSLLLQMFTIFVWAKVFGELFERMHMPAVLGEILAGVILGPYATRFVIPGDTIYSIAEIGAVFLLFTVGLETAPSNLIRVGRLSLGVAFAGVLLPFATGLLFLRLNKETRQEEVFVAAAMVATSVGITARVLRDMNVLKSRSAQIILGAAVFDDFFDMSRSTKEPERNITLPRICGFTLNASNMETWVEEASMNLLVEEQ